MFDLFPSAVQDGDARAAAQPLQNIEATPEQSYHAAYEASRRTQTIMASWNNLHDAAQDHLDMVAKKTGERIENPYNLGANPFAWDIGAGLEKKAAAQAKLSELADKHGDPSLAFPDSQTLFESGLKKARGAVEEQAKLGQGLQDFGTGVASLPAEIGAQFSDPITASLNIAAMTAIPTGGIVKSALLTGGAMGAQQAYQEGLTFKYRQAIDPRFGAGDAAQEVLGAAAGGAAIDLGAHLLAKGAGALWRSWKFDGRPGLPQDAIDAARLAERRDDLDANNPFKTGASGAAAHSEAIQTIEAQLARGERAALPSAAESEARARTGSVIAVPEPSVFDVVQRQAWNDHQELFQKAWGLDADIAQARAELADASKQAATPIDTAQYSPLRAQIADVQGQLDQITGKRRSSPRAKALRAELEDLQTKAQEALGGLTEGAISRAKDRADLLRQRLVELQSDRARLGPDIKAAYDLTAQRRLGVPLPEEGFPLDANPSHSGKQWTAPEEAPAVVPPKDGTVRFYHGAASNAVDPTTYGAWITPHYKYARDYRGGPNTVHYIDIPKDNAELLSSGYDDVNNLYRHFQASKELSKGLKRLEAPQIEAPKPKSAPAKNASKPKAEKSKKPAPLPPPPTADEIAQASAAAKRQAAGPTAPSRSFFGDKAVSVKYELAEAGDLVTSHDGSFNLNPAYPESLQPRNRGGRPAREQVLSIAQKLEPERLGPSVEANSGAPIIGPDNVVESGNGRAMALRTVYGKGGSAAAAYRAYLERSGFDTSGFKEPVLVARRVTQMTDADREAFAHAANGSASLRMSAAEQALSDARHMTGDVVTLWRGGEVNSHANSDFVRAFVAKLPPGERGAVLTQGGYLSANGVNRIKAALVARAFDDPGVVARAFDHADSNIKSIASALVDAAPDWIAMRDAVARGEIPAAQDITADVTQAVKTIMRARDEGEPVGKLLAQGDMFHSDVGQLAARLFFKDGEMKRFLAKGAMGDNLTSFSRELLSGASKGVDMFGNAPASAKEVAQAVVRKSDTREADIAAIAPKPLDLTPAAKPEPGLSMDERMNAMAQARKSGGETAANGGARTPPEGLTKGQKASWLDGYDNQKTLDALAAPSREAEIAKVAGDQKALDLAHEDPKVQEATFAELERNIAQGKNRVEGLDAEGNAIVTMADKELFQIENELSLAQELGKSCNVPLSAQEVAE